ncbi:MAG: cytochrome P450 [Halioglobus sp.]
MDILLPDTDFAYDELTNLHEVLDSLRSAGPVVRVKFHNEPAWLISGYHELRQAFSDEEHFECARAYKLHSEPSMGKTILGMSGSEHRVNRALVSRPFFPNQIRTLLETLIEEQANLLLDKIDRDEPVELVEEFARPFPFKVITRMLGIPVDDDAKLLTWALKIIDFPWDPEGALKAKREFDEYLIPLIERRRDNPGEDIISILATTESEGERLTTEEILSFCRLLFPAGSDTTYKMLGSLFYAILSTDGMKERAVADDNAREALVQEGLRWQPPTALLPRLCSKDIELAGVKISDGDWVLFGITAANSDPAVFDQPRVFNPDRENKNLAFGHGEHFCLGSHLARRELETALKLVFQRFPDLALVEDKPVEITQGVLRGAKSLWVRPRG